MTQSTTESKPAAKPTANSLHKEMEELRATVKQQAELLELLKYQAESISEKRSRDPNVQAERAKRIVRDSLSGKTAKKGRYLWIVDRPSLYKPIEFHSDSYDENAAIREFEKRFGTKFIQVGRESEDDKIKRVDTQDTAS